MRVNEKLTGKEIWGYFINTGENLHGMNRLYLGSKGDYGAMYVFAVGYIDNVRSHNSCNSNFGNNRTGNDYHNNDNETYNSETNQQYTYFLSNRYTPVVLTSYRRDNSAWYYRCMGHSRQDKKELIPFSFLLKIELL